MNNYCHQTSGRPNMFHQLRRFRTRRAFEDGKRISIIGWMLKDRL